MTDPFEIRSVEPPEDKTLRLLAPEQRVKWAVLRICRNLDTFGGETEEVIGRAVAEALYEELRMADSQPGQVPWRIRAFEKLKEWRPPGEPARQGSEQTQSTPGPGGL